MDILILEDEIYLAQKVASKLHDEGHNPTHYATFDEVDKTKTYDAILLSTNIQVGNTEAIIKKYPDTIILLLVAYINDATVTKPIKAGANDYIAKPFSIDELIRKIKHFQEFNNLKKENQKLQNCIDFIFDSVEDIPDIPDRLPFLIETNNQKISDKIVYETAKRLNKEIEFISLTQNPRIDIDKYQDKLVYIHDLHNIKNAPKELLYKSITDKDVILSSFETETNVPFEKVVFKNKNTISSNNTILTINDYVKTMVLKFQSKYPDTELSKKLGISRKSLWEKRKKFGIEKSKK